MRMEKCEFTTGAAITDRKGYALSFKRNFSHKAYFFTGTVDTTGA
jgi:hypothetical protein